MISRNLMLFLMFIYAVIVLGAAYEKNWYLAMYFLGALLISFAVLKGMNHA